MFDHVSIGVRDLARAKRFYDAALRPLGYQSLASGDARRQASEKPRGRKPRGEFAPTLVSIYGEFAAGA